MGDPAATAARCCCERSVGNDKSVDDVVNACENQPESLLGISDSREEDEEEDDDEEGEESDEGDGPKLNGFIDDEAEEYSDEDEDEDSE